MFGIILGLAVGIAMPIQTSTNAKLGDKIRSAYLSSVISFLCADIVCAVVVLLMTGSLGLPLASAAGEPLWIWTGGLCGEALVVISMVCLPKLGSTETMVYLVLGQIFVGLAIDSFGLFKSELIPLTLTRFAGFMLVLGGAIMVSVCNSDKGGSSQNQGHKGLYRVAVLIAGALAGTQVAVNGRLGVVFGNPFKATLLSMSVGLVSAICLIAFLYVFRGGKKAVFDYSLPGGHPEWWLFVGGAYGVFIVGGNVVLAHILGTGMSLILNITGQTFGGVIVDTIGFMGIEKKPVTMAKLTGIVIMIAGICIVNML